MTPTESETEPEAKAECLCWYGWNSKEEAFLLKGDKEWIEESRVGYIDDFVHVFSFCPRCGKSLTP